MSGVSDQFQHPQKGGSARVNLGEFVSAIREGRQIETSPYLEQKSLSVLFVGEVWESIFQERKKYPDSAGLCRLDLGLQDIVPLEERDFRIAAARCNDPREIAELLYSAIRFSSGPGLRAWFRERQLSALRPEGERDHLDEAFLRYQSLLASGASPTGSKDPMGHVRSGLDTSMGAIWKTLGVVPVLLKEHPGIGLQEESLRTLSKLSLRLIEQFASGDIDRFRAFTTRARDVVPSAENPFFRSEAFELTVSGGELKLAVEQKLWAAIERDYPTPKRELSGCSALYAGIVRDQLQWCEKIAEKFFFENVVRK